MHVGFVNIARYFKKVISRQRKGFAKIAFSSKYLLVTNVCISVTLSGVGDILEQNYEMTIQKIDKWDSIRTRNMSISGCTIGVLCHYWYLFLDKQLPGRTFKTVMKKVVLDQIVCSPFTISVFFITLAILEQSSIDECLKEITKKAWRLYVAEWLIWPPAQFINFYILPTKYRVFYDNIISLGYDVYTSYVRYDDS